MTMLPNSQTIRCTNPALPSLRPRPKDAARDKQDDTFDTSAFEVCEEAKEPSEEILAKQAEALGRQFDYDSSRLTLEQRRALFKKYFALHLKLNDLRSPRYYEDKSQCISVAETAWPGIVGQLKVDRLKQGYIEAEDLIERLRQLKPSNNFELRKYHHPRMEWKSPTPLQEEGFEISPPDPELVMDQLYAVTEMGKRLGRRWADQHRQEIRDRWATFKSGVELTPLPDLHLLRDMGRSPGGTLFPWYLVKGLMALREDSDDTASKSYGEEEDRAKEKREEAINGWRESNPDSMLADDPLSMYRTWPADLIAELDEIDREALRCGRRKYVAILRETEKKMQALVAFWRDCGLITGQRAPPPSWWQDPKAKAKHLSRPPYLIERLDAINTEFGYLTDMAKKLRMIETSRWMESIFNGDFEPPSSTALPQSLLDELDIVWRDRDWLNGDDTEDEMIARIRRWRKSDHQRCLEEGLRTSPQFGSDIGPEEPAQNASSSAMEPEETLQVRGKLSGSPCRPRVMVEDRAIWHGRLRSRANLMMAEDQRIWQGRLRPRRGAIGASRKKLHPVQKPTGKPKGIVKQYGRKASEQKRHTRTKDQATITSTTQKASMSHLPGTNSHFNEALLRSTPASVVGARRTKNARQQPPSKASTVRPEGVRKTRDSKGRQTRRLMTSLKTNHNQGFLRLLTPPRSEI
jgi:hypothetical protein